MNDDLQLLQELKNNHLPAFENLFKKYYKLLCNDAFFLLKDEFEAEDVVQSLFTEMWDKKLFAGIQQSLKSYLRRSVRNACLTILEKRKTRNRYNMDFKVFGDERTTANPLEIKELGLEINACIIGLPQQRRKAFELIYLEDMRYKEAASEMGLSVNSLKTHLRITLRTLRKKLNRY